MLFILIALAASGFLPPTGPSWDAEQTVTHYRRHENGIRAGAALLILSGTLYLPFVAAVSAQMRRVPDLHHAIRAIQFAAGSVGGFSILMAGLVLAAAGYRLDRHADVTQALNDLFWISLLSAWPLFMAQSFALACAIIVDSRPKPPFPKAVALVNVMVPVTFIPGIALHCVKGGPVAWNGVVGFWIPVFLFGVEVSMDCLCLWRAASNETDMEQEGELSSSSC